MCIYIYICIHKSIYIYIYIYTHTHTYICFPRPRSGDEVLPARPAAAARRGSGPTTVNFQAKNL